MKPNYFFFAAFTVAYFLLGFRIMKAQVGINTDAPNANAVLDIVSSEKGVLIPRLNQMQSDALSNLTPENGLLIYNTTSECVQIYNRSSDTQGAFYCLTTGVHDLRLVGTGNHITRDAGVGGNGTSAGTGSDNIGVGRNNFSSQTNGSSNIAVGANTLATNTSGSQNITVGYNSAAGLITGNNNTIIGGNVNITDGSLSNNIILADGEGNQRIRVLSDGKTGINKTSPLSTLDVNGSLAANYTFTTSAISLTDKHHFVNASGSGYQITLPDPTTCRNRTYKIRVEGNNITISTYKNLSGINTNTLTTNTSMILVSSGTQWIEF